MSRWLPRITSDRPGLFVITVESRMRSVSCFCCSARIDGVNVEPRRAKRIVVVFARVVAIAVVTPHRHHYSAGS